MEIDISAYGRLLHNAAPHHLLQSSPRLVDRVRPESPLHASRRRPSFHSHSHSRSRSHSHSHSHSCVSVTIASTSSDIRIRLVTNSATAPHVKEETPQQLAGLPQLRSYAAVELMPIYSKRTQNTLTHTQT